MHTTLAELLLDAGIALLASLANGLYVEPKTTESMFKRYELENQDVKDAERIKVCRRCSLALGAARQSFFSRSFTARLMPCD